MNLSPIPVLGKIIVIVLSLIPLSTTAASEAAANQVGPAGCGLGSVIWGKESQVLAATSNMTGTQTLGILFGTSNCAPQSKKAAVIEFVQSNRLALANDASRGSGETLKALSQILGCSNSEILGSALKENYTHIFSVRTDDPRAITERISETVGKSRSLSRSCDHS